MLTYFMGLFQRTIGVCLLAFVRGLLVLVGIGLFMLGHWTLYKSIIKSEREESKI